MKFVVCIVLSFFVLSCDFLESNEVRTKKLVDTTLEEIDWSVVDAYPLFENCDETETKQNQLICFETEITMYFENSLNDFNFILKGDQNVAVAIVFIIDAKGVVHVDSVENANFIAAQIPQFDSVLQQSLRRIPRIAPALKRGIPVRTKFKLPIKINTQE